MFLSIWFTNQVLSTLNCAHIRKLQFLHLFAIHEKACVSFILIDVVVVEELHAITETQWSNQTFFFVRWANYFAQVVLARRAEMPWRHFRKVSKTLTHFLRSSHEASMGRSYFVLPWKGGSPGFTWRQQNLKQAVDCATALSSWTSYRLAVGEERRSLEVRFVQGGAGRLEVQVQEVPEVHTFWKSTVITCNNM